MASNDKDKLNRFLELQSNGVKIEDIATTLELEVKSLRRFLNKNGYKSVNGKYKLTEVNKEVKQLELTIDNNKDNTKSKVKTKDNSKAKKATKDKDAVVSRPKASKPTKETVKSTSSKNTQKKSKNSKVNMTVEDMDKLCEVYDWYLSIKDLKTLQSKKKNSAKDINIEKCDMSNLKSTTIKVDKNTWDEFERLCSNSDYTKQEIITQALKNFLKENKNLL